MGAGEAGRSATIGRWPTLLLALGLFVPYFVDLATDVEPYPSAILPEGGTKLTTADGRVTYTTTTVLGWNPEGDLVPIGARELLDPIWVHYLRYIARNEFGFADRGDRAISVRGVGWTFHLPRHDASADQRDEIRRWLRGRLDELGLDDRGFVVQQVEIEADAGSGDTIDTRVRSETTVDL